MFVGLHLMVAAKTNCPELAIEPDEGIAFMQAAQNVLRHYSVQTTQKTLDWIAFAGVAGGIYLTRGVAISNRRAAEKAARREAGEPAMQFRPMRRKPAADAPQDAGKPPIGAAGGFDLGSYAPPPGALEAAE